MDVELHDDPARFLADAGPLLMAAEARHNLALGITSITRDSPALYRERRFWVVRDEGKPVAAALRTPPHNLVLVQPRSTEALDALTAAIDEELPGVVGAIPEVDGFVERWDAPVAGRRTQGVYALERVEEVARPAGTPRVAGPDDRELLVAWWRAFVREALPGNADDEDGARRAVDHRLTSRDAGTLVWEDGGEIVSLAGWGGSTPNGMRVGPVYTPPERRGAGYATALVADLSQLLLDGGKRFCFLYTDLANPTANAIYVRIGYERVCDSAEVRFG